MGPGLSARVSSGLMEFGGTPSGRDQVRDRIAENRNFPWRIFKKVSPVELNPKF